MDAHRDATALQAEITDEAVLDDTRRALTDAEKNDLLNQKKALYDSFKDNIESARWKAALEDIEKYEAVAKQLYGPKDDLYADVFGDINYSIDLPVLCFNIF